MRGIRRVKNRIVSVLLVVVLLITTIVGCGEKADNVAKPETVPEIDTEALVEEIVNEIQEEIDNQPTKENVVDITKSYSEEWEDYVGDVETFVYGLIIDDLRYAFDVFPAYVQLKDGKEVNGIAYANIDECYVNDDESQASFLVGFLPYVGEYPIPQEEFDEGLTVRNAEYETNDISYILSYNSEPFEEHCVVYGQYVKYGVNNQGIIYYENTDYDRNKIDKSIGSLYSYDEQYFVYDLEYGNSMYLTGESLSEQLDFAEIEREINRVLDEQDFNFSQVDIETYAYASQEAVTNYLLSMQEETFLGYQVSALIEAAQDLDPMQCIRITNEGLEVIDIQAPEKEGESTLVKWLVGTGCVLLTAVGMVGSVIFIECPPLAALSASISGVAIEVFMQVVVNNEKLGEINWTKVAIAAVAGAVSGFLGPYVMATCGGASYFIVDSSIDGIIGAVEQAAEAWMDGETGEEIAKRFGTGFALGFCLSAGFKGVGAAISKIAKKAGPSIAKASEKTFPRFTKKLSDGAKKAGKSIAKLRKSLEPTVFHSKYVSEKMAERVMKENSKQLIHDSVKSLKKDNIVDSAGNTISKKQLEKMAMDANDDTVLAYYKIGDELVQIKKQNEVVGVIFDPTKYKSVELPGGIKGISRDSNFVEAVKIYKKQWIAEPSEIPSSIKNALDAQGTDIEKITVTELKELIQNSDMVLHENIDLKTITLVSRTVHDKAKETGVAHFGGFALAKRVKEYIAWKYFDRLVSQAATDYVIATQ